MRNSNTIAIIKLRHSERLSGEEKEREREGETLDWIHLTCELHLCIHVTHVS